MAKYQLYYSQRRLLVGSSITYGDRKRARRSVSYCTRSVPRIARSMWPNADEPSGGAEARTPECEAALVWFPSQAHNLIRPFDLRARLRSLTRRKRRQLTGASSACSGPKRPAISNRRVDE